MVFLHLNLIGTWYYENSSRYSGEFRYEARDGKGK